MACGPRSWRIDACSSHALGQHRVGDRGDVRLCVRCSIECTDEGRTRGEGEFRFEGRHAWQGRFEVESRVDGQPMKMTIQQESRWLGSDCAGAMGR